MVFLQIFRALLFSRREILCVSSQKKHKDQRTHARTFTHAPHVVEESTVVVALRTAAASPLRSCVACVVCLCCRVLPPFVCDRSRRVFDLCGSKRGRLKICTFVCEGKLKCQAGSTSTGSTSKRRLSLTRVCVRFLLSKLPLLQTLSLTNPNLLFQSCAACAPFEDNVKLVFRHCSR